MVYNFYPLSDNSLKLNREPLNIFKPYNKLTGCANLIKTINWYVQRDENYIAL